MNNTFKVLVTGAAGFIGFHLSKKLLDLGFPVHGLDNLNEYYDVNLKKKRLSILQSLDRFHFHHADITDRKQLEPVFQKHAFPVVINLAAQAGVRYSLTNPGAYAESNITGFLNVLEECRHHQVKHLMYASSSSVYGANKKIPFSTHDNVDHPISLYAATKKANELMAHAYSSLFDIPTTGLRFFTVYGPYGRPDMALYIFTKAILENRPIEVFNHGNMMRDFTYVDDIVQSIVLLMDKIPVKNPGWNATSPDPASSFAPYKIYNIGNGSPVPLTRFIEVIELKLGKKAIVQSMPLQEGDVPETFADIDDLSSVTGFRPRTSIEDGIGKFVDWYLEYNKQ